MNRKSKHHFGLHRWTSVCFQIHVALNTLTEDTAVDVNYSARTPEVPVSLAVNLMAHKWLLRFGDSLPLDSGLLDSNTVLRDS